MTVARPADEFTNNASMGHANLGRMKGAIHLSSPDSLENIILQKDRLTSVLPTLKTARPEKNFLPIMKACIKYVYRP